MRPLRVMDQNELILYLDAIRRHWGSLVTGGAFIGILGIWQGLGHQVSPWVYWMIAILGLGVASYLAWLDEHRKLKSEVKRNQKPDIDGEISRVYIGSIDSHIEMETYSGSVILLEVKTWNKVQMPDIAIREYECMVTTGDVIETSFPGDRSGWTVHSYEQQFGSRAAINLETQTFRPVRYLSAYQAADRIGFYVEGLAPNSRLAKRVTLTLTDYVGGRHVVKAEDVRLVPHHLSGLRH